MSWKRIALAVAAGLLCFGAGVAATRLASQRAERHEAGGEPAVVIDAAAIQLLPDASLRLELPVGFDAGP